MGVKKSAVGAAVPSVCQITYADILNVLASLNPGFYGAALLLVGRLGVICLDFEGAVIRDRDKTGEVEAMGIQVLGQIVEEIFDTLNVNIFLKFEREEEAELLKFTHAVLFTQSFFHGWHNILEIYIAVNVKKKKTTRGHGSSNALSAQQSDVQSGQSST